MKHILSYLSRIFHRSQKDTHVSEQDLAGKPAGGSTQTAAPGSNIRLLVGLGNPGKEYQNTRHNIGFMVLDAFAEKHRLTWGKRQARSIVATGQVHERTLILCKPLTYMNNSGEAVAGLSRFYKLTPADILVVYDDMDLPLGRVRIREGGSAGGHNGMKSIIQHVKGTTFPRMRIGIDRPAHNAINHVLAGFGRDEQPIVNAAVERAVDALDAVLTQGVIAAMNRYNSSN